MPVIDKAVSTEDLFKEKVPPVLGVLRLEAILNTLVENKVEALKQDNGKNSSLHSSPRNILQKLKCQSSPKATLTIEDERRKTPKRKDQKDKSHGHKVVLESRQFKRQVLRQETSSPDSHGDDKCPENDVESTSPSHACYCNQGPVSMQVNDDYISIKMDGFGDVETDAIISQEELKRARRKRRQRRKRKLKKRLALNHHLADNIAHDGEFKSFNDDELPPRAKWTIVATACLLLFMCLLLVGITLRMAPIIDEIGRKRLKRTTSLEEIICDNKKQKKFKTEQRRKSEYYLREADISMNRKKSSKKLKKKCSTHSKSSRGSRGSYTNDIEKGTGDDPRLPESNSTKGMSDDDASGKIPSQMTKEEVARQKRRKNIINIILSVYLFLFCISILSVVVTLTHRSTAIVSVREENEKLINSISNSANFSVTSVQNGIGSTEKLYVLNGVT